MTEPQTSGFRLKIEFAQASDPGRDPNKQVNEDSCGYAQTRFGYLCVLCDGMGGHYGGKEASRTAITTIFEVFEQAPGHLTPAAALKASIEEAGRRVYRLGGPPENRTRPGSTVVAMLLHDKGLDVAHVGDSRAYIIRSNQIYPLTRDHSMVQGMIDAGMLTEESAMGHPDSNKITRALGMKPEVDVEVRPEVMELFVGDVLMQSSDGLTDLALGADILGATRQALASGPVAHACNMLVKMANDRGGHDNITVQMVRVTEVGAKHHTIPDRPQPTNAPVLANGSPYAAPQPTRPGTPAAPQVGAAPQWQPVPVTAPDGTPAPAPSAPRAAPMPTLNEAAPPQSQAWGAPPYAGSPATPQGLAPFRIDPGAGPAALPLPPQSARGFGPPPAGPSPYPTQPGPAPQMGPPSFGAPPSTLAPRGGIVFVIIGLSAVIAVLILVVIWALVLR